MKPLKKRLRRLQQQLLQLLQHQLQRLLQLRLLPLQPQVLQRLRPKSQGLLKFSRKNKCLMFNTVRHCFAPSINKRGGERARSLAGLHFAYYIIYLIICLGGIAAYLG